MAELRKCAKEVGKNYLIFDRDSKCWIDFVNSNQADITLEGQTLRKNPKISLKNLLAVSSAVFFGEGVSEDRRQKRIEICHSCVKFVWDDFKKEGRCGICGCKMRGHSRALVDLAKYEETKQYGCKYPGGSRWKANGV